MDVINKFFKKIFEGLQIFFKVLWIWWQTSLSISNRCGVLSYNNFSSPLCFPLVSFALSLRSDTWLSNGVLFLTKQLQMHSDVRFLLKENFPWKSK